MMEIRRATADMAWDEHRVLQKPEMDTAPVDELSALEASHTEASKANAEDTDPWIT
ncbi:hypothetical protein [Faecalibaculum rodentium]|uniref:hypothetical protein n=1 Tax=Faecalibaculum rodentium TaxID=1702221 RepID=UPI003F67AA1F